MHASSLFALLPLLAAAISASANNDVSSAYSNITYFTSDTIAPPSLPLPSAASHCDEIVALFAQLGRSTTWKLINTIPLEGETGEPEGIVRFGDDRFIVSGGVWTSPTAAYKDAQGKAQLVNGTDRSTGTGLSHLLVFDGKGKRVAQAVYNRENETEYHNGGIDYDGKYIWQTVAQYRPNSTATLMRVDPRTLQAENVIRIKDHQGGVVHDTLNDKLYTLNWGSRNASVFSGDPYTHAAYPAFTRPLAVTRNPSYFVDYQDAKWCGHPQALGGRPTLIASGVATIGSGNSSYNLGGIALVDADSMIPFMEMPIPLSSQLGGRMTQNPMDIGVVDGKLRLWWAPDQHNTTVYEYEAQVGSFQFGGSGGLF